ncbi:hypothetical protein A3E39_01285 [Candidatus Uhrbacteria bacterium RIFCSPHIGHO2_12_FULL_60_25]|uniref:DUF4931 domain-containing protein n=1 Tax=Candidatus Uhrbacteria bacterium RIFCSPHIGHO2_12_FULL_60_25 TaxID=1802399 RepID=A0A1F7UM47_9BACT|nr:MAG: hypothetical protein A3E39_01285 [Candidatus Uhrbacteria bacterium RIFCSPHIGHO2_12_FULL_60_25]
MKRNAYSWISRDARTGGLVFFAPHRTKRFGKKTGGCSFCPKGLNSKKVLARAGSFLSVANSYPIFVTDGSGVYGRQELIVEGREHAKQLASWDARRIEKLLAFYAGRFRRAFRDRRITSVLLYKNEGKNAGATQLHPHAQLWAMSVTGPLGGRPTTTRGIPFFEDRHVTATVPEGPFDHEVRITTKRRAHDFGQLTAAERRSVAEALTLCFRYVRRKKLDFNFFMYSTRKRGERFELRFVPREGVFAGAELGSGLYVNSTDTAQAAKDYTHE